MSRARGTSVHGVRTQRTSQPSSAVPPASSTAQLSSSGWIMPQLAPPSLLQAAQLRLCLGSLLHQRLGSAAVGGAVKDVDVVECIAQFIAGCGPLAWTRSRETLAIDMETSSVAMAQGGDYGAAMTADAPMREGKHYAEFDLLSSHLVTLGVADLRFDPFGEERMATATEYGWGYRAWDGKHSHASSWSAWDGMQPATCGDTIGLLMDCDAGTLCVFKNGEWLGVLCTNVAGLSGGGGEQGAGRPELCWIAQLWVDGAAVRVRREERPRESSREIAAMKQLRRSGCSAGCHPASPMSEQVPPWAGGNPLTSMDELQREARSNDLVLPLPPPQQRFDEGSPPPLPPGWIIVTSREDGAPYFYNQHTGESCWHVPAPLPPPPGPPARQDGHGPELADLPLHPGGGNAQERAARSAAPAHKSNHRLNTMHCPVTHALSSYPLRRASPFLGPDTAPNYPNVSRGWQSMS